MPINGNGTHTTTKPINYTEHQDVIDGVNLRNLCHIDMFFGTSCYTLLCLCAGMCLQTACEFYHGLTAYGLHMPKTLLITNRKFLKHQIKATKQIRD